MTALFSLLSGDAVEYADDAAIEIRAIIDNEEPADGGVNEDVFLELARWYAYLSHEAIRFHAYTTRGEAHGRAVLPYPYYILAGETLLLISRDELSYIAVQDPRLVAAYRSSHAAQCAARQEIANTETGYEAILQFFIGLWQSVGRTPIYLLTPRPCLWLCSSDDMVRRYLHDEQFVQYGQMYRALNLCEFTTHSGMERFLSEGRIAEAGFDIPAEPEDLTAVRAMIEHNTGTRTFYLDETRIHLPEDWQIFLVAHRIMVLVPYRTSSYMMCCTSSAVVDAMTEWCESRCACVR